MSEQKFTENARRRCREIMTSSVKTANREMSLAEVARLMRDGDMGALPVTEGERLVGIVTDRDIVVRAIADGKDYSTAIGDVMTTEIYSVKPDDFVFEAIRLMGDKQVRRVPIINDAGTLVGIVTDRDIVVRAIAEGKSADTQIGDVMTSEIFSVKEDDFVFEAIRLMGDKQVRRVPIINERSELVGIIAMADVALETEDEREIAETLEEISSGKAFWRKG
jgi:CBS domain-containing protein